MVSVFSTKELVAEKNNLIMVYNTPALFYRLILLYEQLFFLFLHQVISDNYSYRPTTIKISGH
jgi:hypothetical protein